MRLRGQERRHTMHHKCPPTADQNFRAQQIKLKGAQGRSWMFQWKENQRSQGTTGKGLQKERATNEARKAIPKDNDKERDREEGRNKQREQHEPLSRLAMRGAFAGRSTTAQYFERELKHSPLAAPDTRFGATPTSATANIERAATAKVQQRIWKGATTEARVKQAHRSYTTMKCTMSET